jgi:hypothetical protein
LTFAAFLLTPLALTYVTSATAADLAPERAPHAAATVKNEKAAVDASLPKASRAEAEVMRWLKQGRGSHGASKLEVKRFTQAVGLLATYQATNGKRLAFKANWRADGTIRSEIAHYSQDAKQVIPLLARSRVGADKRSVLRLSDFDVISELQHGVFAKKAPTGQLDAVARFMASDEGGALSEAVPALYLALEDFDHGESLIDLYSMYGALLMSMQLSSGIKVDVDRVQTAVAADKYARARALCDGKSCKAAGNKFVVHIDGQFDMLTKSKDIAPKQKNEAVLFQGNAPAGSDMNPLRVFRKNGDGNCTDLGGCFGKCGRECNNPGNIETSECWGHDLCVCKWGDSACVFTVPTGGGGCNGCNTLIEAAWSFVAAFFSQFGDEPQEDPFEGPDSGAYWQGW